VVHYRLLPRVREWRNSFVKGGQPDKPALELRQWSELWRSRPEAKFQVAGGAGPTRERQRQRRRGRRQRRSGT
jgi:hypothetical protein